MSPDSPQLFLLHPFPAVLNYVPVDMKEITEEGHADCPCRAVQCSAYTASLNLNLTYYAMLWCQIGSVFTRLFNFHELETCESQM